MLGLAGRGSLCRVAECERDGRAPNIILRARARRTRVRARNGLWLGLHTQERQPA